MNLTVREERILAGLAQRAARRARKSVTRGNLAPEQRQHRDGRARELEALAEKLEPWFENESTRGGRDVADND